MFIERLKLVNFRNYENLDINFDKNINIFYGNNAQGKTNILEALYFVATGKSHRTNKDKELISWNHDNTYINTYLTKENRNIKIDLKINNEHKKSININDVPIKKIGELIGNLNAVMFSPEDLKIVKEGPSERRKFIDISISQIKPHYFYNLQQYIKILHQRNALIKDISKNKSLIDTLSIWDNNLVEIGSKIMYYRYVFLSKIQYFAKDIHYNLSNEEIKIEYLPSFNTNFNSVEKIKEDFKESLQKNLQKDIKFGLTNIGPHRDDFDIFIDDINVRLYGSQGQQRTVSISLKLAEINLIHDALGEYPILLLDDVLSELDDTRQRYLLQNIKDLQVFLTCTSIDDHFEGIRYKVENGKVTRG